MHEECQQTTVRRSPSAGKINPPTDALLLSRFASNRDEEAFALLVERHGPLVLAVCRRVLGNVQDAEDAFQATFLVLARRAASIRDRGLLGNWLYGVALRIARKVRAAVSKRQLHEKQAQWVPSLQVPPAVELADLTPVLDEELSRLPEKYRAALVLCYLQGKSHAEAADVLCWPAGMVKGRLAKARALLRSRLLRRGFGVTTALLAAFLLEAQARAATVPDLLAETTVRAGVSYAGSEMGVGTPSPRPVRLAQTVLGSTAWPTLVSFALALLLLAVAGAGAAGWLFSASGQGNELGWGGSSSCHRGGKGAEQVGTSPAP
jgi:RNA polymerase sigma-70 factor (ECF subfamily)